VNQLVPGEQAYAEFSPRLRGTKSEQIVEIDREVGTVEPAHADVHNPRKGAAPVIAGACDNASELTECGFAKRDRDWARWLRHHVKLRLHNKYLVDIGR
jgi:hypothetical protein